MLDEKKMIVNLLILDKVVSLMIADKDEETVRCAAKKLNDRANDIKEKNPSFGMKWPPKVRQKNFWGSLHFSTPSL